MTTELALENWRAGSTQAERLSTELLGLSGFKDVQPQAPLGGPDDRKDILCAKAGKTYVAAVYFPTSNKRFTSIKNKFLNDLEGPKRHNRDGIVFVTNQRLTEGNHNTLAGIALEVGKECFILDRERIRASLDAPEGYGVRAAFLGIPMTLEEQLAFFVHERNVVDRAVENNTIEMGRLGSKMDRLLEGQDLAIRTLHNISTRAVVGSSSTTIPAGGSLSAEPMVGKLSAQLNPELILAVHRFACADLPPRMIGRFRDVAVWLAEPETMPLETAPALPSPQEVPRLLSQLCDEWNEKFGDLEESKAEQKLEEVAKFHARLLQIHPFLDGNGRMARALLIQQCVDLFGRADPSVLEKGARYFAALQSADRDNYGPLSRLLRPIIGELPKRSRTAKMRARSKTARRGSE